MTIFVEDDVVHAPVLVEWQIIGGPDGKPALIGLHAFHEGMRAVAQEVLIADPLLRWAITTGGSYRLGGTGTSAMERAPYPSDRGH